jgi:thiamine biosynthesis lipoprotein
MNPNKVCAWLAVSLAAVFLFACKTEPKQQPGNYIVVEGNTMGTYYRVTYADSAGRDFSADIDALLKQINLEISTYIDSSTISRFNKAEYMIDLGIDLEAGTTTNRHFWTCWWKGLEMYQKSGGAFDPTIMPLVNYWGFGYTEKRAVTQADTAVVDSLRRFVGLNKVVLEKGPPAILRKSLPGVQLDFSALGQGYGVDAIAEFLEGREVQHFLVDIGGEQRAKGNSSRGDAWRIGISVPQEGADKQDIITSFPLENLSVNTSGNYRNYYDVEGVKYGHTISPFTGFPQKSNLLSATIFAKDCLTADVWATSCMVLGPEKAMQLVRQQPEMEALFVLGTEDGGMKLEYTPGLKKFFK